MKIDPEQGRDVPGNDEPTYKNGGGDSIFGFADILDRLVRSRPMLLPLLRKYGFHHKKPLIRSHRHKIDKDGKDIGFREFNFGTRSLLSYFIFGLELVIRLVVVCIYLAAILAILLVVLRGLELPEYVQGLWNDGQQQAPTEIRLVE
jgi:hypothetical protein